MSIREGDALPYLRLKQKMQASVSDCTAVLKDGSKTEVYIFRNKPAIEVGEQFYFADTYPDFVRYEKKSVAPLPVPKTVQEVDNWIEKDEPVDTSGQRLRMQLQRNPDVIYKRNLIRQVFGNLLVTEYLGVGQSDSLTRYWSCKCKLTGKSVIATQADLTVGEITCCKNAKKPTQQIVNRGAQLS